MKQEIRKRCSTARIKCLAMLAIGYVALGCLTAAGAERPEEAVKPASHILYFGFADVDTLVTDPYTPVTTPYYSAVPGGGSNYISEVGGFSNLNALWVNDPSMSIESRLNQFHASGSLAIVDVKDVFLKCSPGSGGLGSGTICTLRKDWSMRWRTFLATSNITKNLATIGAFYIADEPAWNNVDPSDLATIATAVKTSFPSIPAAYVEAYQMVDPSSPERNGRVVIPKNVDWVGFDHYGTRNPATDPTYQKEFDVLKSKMTSLQKLIIVFESEYYDPMYAEAGASEYAMKTVFNNYVAFANANPNCIALLGWLWPGGASPVEGNRHLGARELPVTVQGEYVRVGKLIKK
jgi:hypothetical protein